MAKKQLDKDNVLVIGDTHIPYCLEGYLDFVKEVQKDFNCGTVIHIGDLVDFHAISFHESDPDLMSAGDELIKSIELLKPWAKAFPNLKICYGNHDRLPMRQTKALGLPSRMLKSLGEILDLPETWEFDMNFIIDGVLYYHGDGSVTPATSLKKAAINGLNTVHGHAHTNAGVYFQASETRRIWAMNVGCGIDRNKKAFDYQRFVHTKPVIGCGVVLNKGELPVFLPMDLGSKKF